ncbi:phosphotransferase [Rhodococcus rhodnii]|uniref:phosphotransferase n=1 Tax=Rhodococcus rhodnii TaxID=38312 RepID=UPI0009F9EDDC|nr:phosphotransferase [Rhodococcus rhodnii]
MGPDTALTGLAEAPLRYAPEDLNDYQEVREVLTGASVGAMVDPIQLGGRNPNWVSRTTRGHSVFVKYEANPLPTHRTHSRTKTFHTLLELDDTLRQSISTPTLRAMSEDGRVQVYDVVPRSPTAQQRLIEQTLHPLTMYQIGQSVGALHSADTMTAPAVHPAGVMPSGYAVGEVDDAIVPGLSAAQLVALRLLHGDHALYVAATRLLSDMPSSPSGLLHGDLRLDQILISDNEHHWIVDWEEFGIGPTARDLGSLIGDIVNSSVIASLCVDSTTASREVHETAVQSGLTNAKKLVAELCVGYHEAWCRRRPNRLLDRAWASEVSRFAGWHQFDRLLANAAGAVTLTAQSRALAGVGRVLLLDPDAFIEEFELDRIMA